MRRSGPDGFSLKSSLFRREREQSWKELESLVDRIEAGGIRGLAAEELGRLPSLYHSAVSSLSVARAISLDKALLLYLERLVARAYISVYGTKRPATEAVREFLLESFPRTVRRYRRYLAASVAILCIGMLAGFLLTRADEERFYSLVPVELAGERTPEATTETLRSALYDRPESGVIDSLNLFASFLFTHNAKIGILCFALGFAAGAPAVYLLFYNGLGLGAMAALYHDRGLGWEFWAWVPHGITELGAVALCGMAGLVIGLALVFPGRFSRLDNLARRGREVAMVVIGAVILFFIAALIESFFRQLVHSMTARWLVAAGSLLMWTWYFTRFGRTHGADDDR